MARNLLAVSLFACLNLAFGTPAIDGRIAGGYEARDNQFPYQAAIYILSSEVVEPLKDEFCSGSLISENYVLTAAHCLTKAERVTVVLGGPRLDELSPNQVKIDSTEFIISEHYSTEKFTFDIGLIKLSEPVKFTDSIQPVKLTRNHDNHAGDIATVAGWGATYAAQFVVEPALRYIDSVIISYEQCVKNNSWYEQVVEWGVNICQLADGKSACRGDSGAPLVMDGEQVGLVAYTPANCFRGHPVIYTKVAAHFNWIRQNSDVQE